MTPTEQVFDESDPAFRVNGEVLRNCSVSVLTGESEIPITETVRDSTRYPVASIIKRCTETYRDRTNDIEPPERLNRNTASATTPEPTPDNEDAWPYVVSMFNGFLHRTPHAYSGIPTTRLSPLRSSSDTPSEELSTGDGDKIPHTIAFLSEHEDPVRVFGSDATDGMPAPRVVREVFYPIVELTGDSRIGTISIRFQTPSCTPAETDEQTQSQAHDKTGNSQTVSRFLDSITIHPPGDSDPYTVPAPAVLRGPGIRELLQTLGFPIGIKSAQDTVESRSTSGEAIDSETVECS